MARQSKMTELNSELHPLLESSRIFLNRTEEAFCFFRGFGQLSSSIGRQGMTGQSQSHKTGCANLKGTTSRLSTLWTRQKSVLTVYRFLLRPGLKSTFTLISTKVEKQPLSYKAMFSYCN